MPVLDGIELITRVAESYPSIKIVLVSAYSEFEYAKTAISCGVSEYLLKPFRTDDVRKILAKLEKEISTSRDRTYSPYDNLLRKSVKDRQLRYLLTLLERKKLSVPTDFSLKEKLSGQGFLAIIRWKVRLPGGFSELLFSGNMISDTQQDALITDVLASFPEGIPLLLHRGLNSSERKLALLLPGTTLEEVHADFQLFSSNCAQKQIIFWAALSGSCENLLADLYSASIQAETSLAFSFYYPAKSRLFIEDSGEAAPSPMFSLAPYEKVFREDIRSGNIAGLTKSINDLKKFLGKKPLRYPRDIRHRISSAVVSFIRDLDGMISVKDYDREQLESFLYGTANNGHMGLSNVHNRLTLIYGDNYQIHVESAPDEGTTICITLPLEF